MFDYLQNSFKLIGSEREVLRNRELLEQGTVQASIRCETCEELGGSCNSYQREVMRKELRRDNRRLESELMGHFERKEEILNIL